MFAERYAKEQASPENIDYLEGYNILQRLKIGAGKATNDFLSTFGLNPVDGYAPADKALEKDTAAQVGGGLAQLGMMYLGGRLIGGAGTALNAARSVPVAGKVAGAAGKGLQWLGAGATAPTSYAQAGTAAGLFGYASKPGDQAERLTNAAFGGVDGMAGLSVGRGIGHTADYLKSLSRGPIEQQVTAKLTAKGIDFNALPRAVQQQMLKVARNSMDALDSVDPKELARAADFQALGIKPTKGWITRDPQDWWMENTLNTVNNDVSGRFRDANQTLLQQVKNTAPDATDYQLGRKLSDVISGHDLALKTQVDDLYSAARGMAGRDIPLDAHRFVNDASKALDDQMIGSKLPGDTLSWFKKVTDGSEPFDMGTAMQRLQAINQKIYDTTDKGEQRALGIVKTHLINALDDYGNVAANADQAGLSSAFREARSAAANRFKFQDSSPIVDKVLSGKYTPEQLPDIVGKMRVDDLTGLAKLQAENGVPVMDSMRDAARAFIRDSATLQGETGGSFTVNGMRKALDKIGPEKGKLLFGGDGWEKYQQILRAAGNINNAPLKPAGSSTAPNFLRILDRLQIPNAGNITMGISGISKVKGLLDTQRALSGAATMPALDPKTSLLPLVGAPGLLTLTNQAR